MLPKTRDVFSPINDEGKVGRDISSNNGVNVSTIGTQNALKGAPDSRSVIGSCLQIVSIVITVLFKCVQENRYYTEIVNSATATRTSKLLYVQLLEKVQRQRGEWHGFEDDFIRKLHSDSTETSDGVELLHQTLAQYTNKEEKIQVLNEILDISFRNLRGPLITSPVYARYKKGIYIYGLGNPPSLELLLYLRKLVSELGLDIKFCLLRLLKLWNVCAMYHPDTLRNIIANARVLVLCELSDEDFMAARGVNRHESTAIQILEIMVRYCDVLFSEIEFLPIRHEMQVQISLADQAQTESIDVARDDVSLQPRHVKDTTEADVTSLNVSGPPISNINVPAINDTNSPIVPAIYDTKSHIVPIPTEYLNQSQFHPMKMSKKPRSISSESGLCNRRSKQPSQWDVSLSRGSPSPPYSGSQRYYPFQNDDTDDEHSSSSDYSNRSIGRYSTTSQPVKYRSRASSHSIRGSRRPKSEIRNTYAGKRTQRSDESISKTYVTLSLAAATICTMATMIFLSWKKQS